MNGIVRGLAVTGISLGALVAATGCGLTTTHLTAAPLKPASHASAPTAQPARATTSQPGAQSPAAARSDDPATPAAAPSAPAAAGYQGPHFSTPEAAMAYLAAAYNSGNSAALHAVTTPDSYQQLTQMRSEAVNLQLLSCRVDASRGDYFCDFSHDYPASLHQAGHGGSEFLVAPAENPGWYMYTLVECG